MGALKEMMIRVPSLLYSLVSFCILTVEYTGPLQSYQHKGTYEMYKVINTTINDEWFLTYTQKKIEKDEETKYKSTIYILVEKTFVIKNITELYYDCQNYQTFDEADETLDLVNSKTDTPTAYYYLFIIFNILYLLNGLKEIFYYIRDKTLRGEYESDQQALLDNFMSAAHAGSSAAILIPIIYINYDDCIKGAAAQISAATYEYILSNYILQNALFIFLYICEPGQQMKMFEKFISGFGDFAPVVIVIITLYASSYFGVLIYCVSAFSSTIILGIQAPMTIISILKLYYYLYMVLRK